MIYPLDFRLQSENGSNKNKFTVSVFHDEFVAKNHVKSSSFYKKNKQEENGIWKGCCTGCTGSIWHRYCNNSTVHGLRYLTEPNVQTNERLVWLVLVILALFGAIYVSLLLQTRYSTNVLATVVETTIFPISSIPYPAVTICNNNRINWLRVPAAIDFFLKNASNATIGKLSDMIVGLNAFEFSAFEEFEHLIEMNLTDLNHINITELYLSVTHSCEEMFIEPCWWRNKYINCCGHKGLFVLQKSEYGICYAFNSVLNSEGSIRYLNETNFPWRTTKFGDWSGIRANIQLNDSTKIPHIKRRSGILVMAHHPLTWPINSNFIPAGTSASVKMKPIYSYASLGVLKLQPKERNCLMMMDGYSVNYSGNYAMDEVHKYSYHTLPDTQYFLTNCICNCRMQYLISTCNCTVDFIYPSANNPQCKASDLKCLFDNNDLYNHEKPLPGNQYFSDDEQGMVCDCLPECDAIDYAVDVTPMTGSNDDEIDQILLDVHFQKPTIFKYRTDVVFDWLDLMVGFGGIAGLFLGCSLISIAELVFYFTIGLIRVLHQIKMLVQ